MNDPLTPLERRVYHFLLDFLAENTYQPSVREIGRRFRIKSTKTVAELLQALADKGFIEREGARSRGVRIVGWSSMGHVQPVPLYAKVNATEPHLTEQNLVRWIAMDRSLCHRMTRSSFARPETPWRDAACTLAIGFW